MAIFTNRATLSYSGGVINSNTVTGLFTTLPGISVPAATFTRNPDGTFTVTPGVATVTVTGTV